MAPIYALTMALVLALGACESHKAAVKGDREEAGRAVLGGGVYGR